MAVDVSVFSAAARSEFMKGKMAAEERVIPAAYDLFTTKVPSTTKIETHTYMSALPRLYEFKGQSFATRATDYKYTVTNREWRIGPVSVRKTDLDDDQIGGYLQLINGLPQQGQKDIGWEVLKHLANGTSTKCFDETNFFADSHNVGTGDNLMTANYASNDGVTHKVIALNLTNPIFKPVLFQDRESLSELMTDADTPAANKLKEYEYWADTRFGMGYGYWWDAIHLTVTDTPTIPEIIENMVPDIVNRFRTFTLPKGADTDVAQYVHENWMPDASNLVFLCNLQLAEQLTTAISRSQYEAGTAGKLDNVYQNKITIIPTSSLN
jgi:phage major head subunit gpT-like protein